MTSIKGSLLNLLGVLGAIAIAPFVAVFGLMMLGFRPFDHRRLCGDTHDAPRTCI